MKKIGFIGLGNMGLPMAMNLLNGGNELSVFDMNKDAVKKVEMLGATSCDNPLEVGAKSDIIFLSLPNATIIESVVLGEEGLLKSLAKGSVIIDMSSSEPSSTKKLYRILKEKGIDLLDSPVSGAPEGAAQGSLSIMVGGDVQVVEAHLPLLNLLGDKVSYVGDSGAGHAIKSINNLLYGSIFVASCEAMALGVKSGIKAETLLDVISSSAGRNFAIDVKFPSNVMQRNFTPGFSTDLLKKDMEIALSLGKEEKVPLSLSQLASQFITIAQQKGYGNQDHTALIQFFEELTGSKVQSKEGV